MAVDLSDRMQAIAASKAARAEAIATRYLDAVYDCVDDAGGITPDELAEILDAAGRSMVQLQADCETLVKRRELAELLAQGEDANEKAAEVQTKIDQAARKRQESWNKHTSVLMGLGAERDHFLNQVGAAANCRRELQDSAWPHLKERVAAVRARLSKLGINTLEDHLFHLRGIERSDAMNLAVEGFRGPTPEEKVALEGHLRGVRAEIADAERRLGDLVSERDRLLNELALVELEMETP